MVVTISAADSSATQVVPALFTIHYTLLIPQTILVQRTINPPKPSGLDSNCGIPASGADSVMEQQDPHSGQATNQMKRYLPCQADAVSPDQNAFCLTESLTPKFPVSSCRRYGRLNPPDNSDDSSESNWVVMSQHHHGAISGPGTDRPSGGRSVSICRDIPFNSILDCMPLESFTCRLSPFQLQHVAFNCGLIQTDIFLDSDIMHSPDLAGFSSFFTSQISLPPRTKYPSRFGIFHTNVASYHAYFLPIIPD